MKNGSIKIATDLVNEGIELEIKTASSLALTVPDYMDVNEHFNAKIYSEALEHELKRETSRRADREEYTSQMASLITTGKRTFKGVVTESVIGFYEDLMSKVNSTKVPNPIDLFKVKEVEIPPLLTAGIETWNLEPLRGAKLSMISFEGSISLEPKLEYLITGAEALDSEITEAYHMKGIHQETWNLFFGGMTSTTKINNAFESVNDFDMMDRLLPVFLAYDRMVRDTGFEAVSTKMDNTSYRVSVINMRKWLGTKIMGAHSRVKAAMSNNVLVHLTNASENFILVDKAVYEDFLFNGGSVELILGRLVHDDGMRTLEEISANITKYVGAWQTFTTISNRSRNESMLENDRKFILECLDKEVLRKYPPYKVDADVNKARADSVIVSLVNELSSDWREDMQGFCLKAICETFYPDSYAYTFLSNIEKVAAANPEMSAEDVDFIATVEYLTVYLSSQIQIKVN